MTLIRLSLDGDKYCAIIGDMPREKCVGFGVTPFDALHDMIDDLSGRNRGKILGLKDIDLDVIND